MDEMEKVQSDKKLYTRMRLWEFPDQYILEPVDGTADSYLAISRVDGSMKLIGELPECDSTQSAKVRIVFGVIGMLKLLVGVYLLVITECQCVGSYLGHAIFKVSSLQILPCNHSLNSSSAEQVRGSIPLLWEQIVDLTYKPAFEIVRPEEAPRVVERHFLDISKRYRSVLAVDLVNKHGCEGRLSEKFSNAMQIIASDSIRYIHFDFHRICGHVHFERLSQLYDQIEDYLKKHGYFLLNAKGEKVEAQLGVVRSNCIDCLDRTNVTQSMIGRKMLEKQLHRIGIFGADETINAYANLDSCFKISWANHGDEISIQYSGTPALKGDFVRYGKRTVQGILNDGWNALARYYLNNFSDGTRQDVIDLLQGHYIVSVNRDLGSPSQAIGLEAFASFRWASALVLAGLVFAMMSLRQARSDGRHLLFSIGWAGLSLGIAAFVRANGRLFTNRPRLLKQRH